MQLSEEFCFVKAHAREIKAVSLNAGQAVNLFENCRLITASGWND
jgi:hypothetical protein